MRKSHRKQNTSRVISRVHHVPLASGWLGLAVTVIVLGGCRSDDGATKTRVEILKPSEWFASAESSEEADPESGISGKTRGDISVPPTPPPIRTASPSSSRSASPPPAPAASGDSYYGVQRTGSKSEHGGDTREPKLLPVPGAY